MFFIGLFSSFLPYVILAVIYSLSFWLDYVYIVDKEAPEGRSIARETRVSMRSETADRWISYAACLENCVQTSGVSVDQYEGLQASFKSGSDKLSPPRE